MKWGQTETLLRQIRRLASSSSPAPSDKELVQRFVTRSDQGAFEALVRRHGPMVLSVCRRVLHNRHDAEDAFQATFLTLARKAGSLCQQESVGNWLYGVAYRQALNLRAAAARRSTHEGQSAPKAVADPTAEITLREAQEILDAEMSRLPEKYRAPLVLCCLEGLARDEAARQLRLPLATLKSRLERGRRLLRARLTRRGLTLALALSASFLGEGLTQAALPGVLVNSTLQAVLSGAGEAAAGSVSLPQAVLTLTGTRLKLGATLLLGAVLLAAGFGLLGHREAAPDGPGAAAGAGQPDTPDGKPVHVDRFGDPLPPGALARLGTISWRMDGPSADAMAVAPDGKTLITVNACTGIVVWDTVTGRTLRHIPEEPELKKEWLGRQFGSASALSADGRKAVLIPNGGVIHVVDVVTGKAHQSCRNPLGGIARSILSENGKILVTMKMSDPQVQIWDTGSGQLLRTLPAAHKQDGVWKTQWLALSGDGKTLAWVGEDKECPIHVVDVPTGEERRILGDHDGGERQVVLAPDGRFLVSTSSHGLVQLWDVPTGRIVHTWPGREETPPPPMAAFTPDSKKLLLTRATEAMRLLDVSSGKELWQVPRPFGSSVQDAYAFAPEGKTLFFTTGSSPVIFHYDVATGRRLLSPGEQVGRFCEVKFSADEKNLFTLGDDHLLSAWDAGTGKEERRTDVATFGGDFSPDGRLLAVVKGKEVRLLETATGRELWQRQPEPARRVSGIDFSPDGRILALNVGGKNERSVVLLDAASGTELRRVPLPESAWQLAFTADSKSLVWNSENGDNKGETVLHFLDVATGRERPEIRLPPNRGLTRLSPDVKTIMLNPNYPQTSLDYYETATGNRRLEIKPIYTWPTVVALSPDQRTVLVGDGQCGIQFHDAFDGRQLFRLTGHRGGVSAITISPSGRLLATTSTDGTALVWDAAELLRKGRVAPEKLSTADLSSLWDDLAGADAAQAYRAIGRLSASAALPWLRARLQPVPAAPVDEKRLERFVSELDSDDFQVRERATREIEKFGEFAQPTFERVLSGKPSAEVRFRIAQLAEKYAPAQTPERLRALRAVEVLEHVGTAEARSLLEELARGAPQARVTREAKASLARLTRQSTSSP